MKYPGKPRILSRSEWGGHDIDVRHLTELNVIPEKLIVHMTGDENDALAKIYGDDDEGFFTREQEIQMQLDKPYEKRVEQFGDIAYNFGIGIGAKIMEGRSLKYRGGHMKTQNGLSNSNTLGVVVLATDCPGTNIYNELQSIRGEVFLKLYPNVEQPY